MGAALLRGLKAFGRLLLKYGPGLVSTYRDSQAAKAEKARREAEGQ